MHVLIDGQDGIPDWGICRRRGVTGDDAEFIAVAAADFIGITVTLGAGQIHGPGRGKFVEGGTLRVGRKIGPLRLRDLVSPVGKDGDPDPNGRFVRAGASTIYREQGNRLIAVKFSVKNRDLAGAVAEAQDKTKDLLQAPYRAEWSGELCGGLVGGRRYF